MTVVSNPALQLSLARVLHLQTYLDDAFTLLDNDGNGFISLDELVIQLSHVHSGSNGESYDDAEIAEEVMRNVQFKTPSQFEADRWNKLEQAR